MSELRPHVALASTSIHDVVQLPDGGLACHTSAGLELFDASLKPRGTITGESDGALSVLPDGRFLVARRDHASSFAEGRTGGALAKHAVDDALSLVSQFVPTERGFLGVAFKGLLVDVDGTRTVKPWEGRCEHGGVAWEGGAVLAGFQGVTLVDATGTELAYAPDVQVSKRPMRVGAHVVIVDPQALRLLDGSLREVATLPVRTASLDAFVPFRDGFLATWYDEDSKSSYLRFWVLENGTVVARWTVEEKAMLAPPIVAGDHIVARAYDGGVWILNGEGSELGTMATKDYSPAAAPLGDGVVISERNAFGAHWWRPDGSVTSLPHDTSPEYLLPLSDGRVVSTDRNALYIWNAVEQGPERSRVSASLPLNKLIRVRHGGLLRVLGPGWFAMYAKYPHGDATTVAADSEWRELVSREDAARIVERLAARAFVDDPPAPDVFHAFVESTDAIGKMMFSPSSVEDALGTLGTRGTFFEELALSLGVDHREIISAIRVRKTKLVPPRPVPGYLYLGSFTTSGDMIVADPCYKGRKSTGIFSLSHKIAGHDGIWHMFVRIDTSDRRRTAELVTIHDNGFDVNAAELVASVGVDSGTMGVYDKKCPKRDESLILEEGPYAALGAISSTAWGDGMYPVYTGSLQGRVAKIRVHFMGDDGDIDRTLQKPQAAAKPYSIKTTYAAGDVLEHPKFGKGSVIRIGADGKIDVRFPDATRTLVHARK